MYRRSVYDVCTNYVRMVVIEINVMDVVDIMDTMYVQMVVTVLHRNLCELHCMRDCCLSSRQNTYDGCIINM